MKRFGKLIKEADQFSVPVTLTYQAEKDFKSITSGLVSLIVIVFFAYVFVGQFIAMLNRSLVNSKTEEFKRTEPLPLSLNESNFMFSLLVSGMDLTSGPRYFDIFVTTGTYKKGVSNKTDVNMERCTREHWGRLGDQTNNFFQLYNMQSCLCPPRDFNVDLKGKFTLEEFKDLQIHIRKCTGVVGVDCRTAVEIDAFLAANMYKFTLGIIYMDTLVDPDNQNPYTYYINDDFYWGFSPQQGMQVMMQVRTQTVNTDNSLLPIEDISTIVSPVIQPPQLGSYAILNLTVQDYVSVFVMLSSTSIRITRSFYKFDELLAYLGGLFGLIALIVDLPLRAYNQMCHDVGISHYLFDYDSEPIESQAILSKEQELDDRKKGSDQKIVAVRSLHAVAPLDGGRETTEESESVQAQPHSYKRLNFLMFMIVAVYKIFKKCDPRKKCSIEKLNPYVNSLEEIDKELDIRNLLQRLLILERAVKCLMPAPLYTLLPYFKRQNIYHLRELTSKLKHYKHIVNLKFKEEDEKSTEQLQKLVGEILQSNDELSRRMLGEVDKKVLRICGRTARTALNGPVPEEPLPLILNTDAVHENTQHVADKSFEYLN